MLKKFTLKNYKNFKDEISIDFENIAGYQFSTDCIIDGIISKISVGRLDYKSGIYTYESNILEVYKKCIKAGYTSQYF